MPGARNLILDIFLPNFFAAKSDKQKKKKSKKKKAKKTPLNPKFNMPL